MPEDTTQSAAHLKLSWRVVAITTSLLALMGVTSTVIVATIKEADTLSTVALGLAVIAFVIQIIVYIVQAESANRQQLSFQEVYGSTMKALASIEEKAEITRREVEILSAKMLDAALNTAVPEAIQKGISADSPEFYAKLRQEIEDVFAASQNSRQSTGDSAFSGVSSRAYRLPRRLHLAAPLDDPEVPDWEFPREADTAKIIETLTNLSGPALGTIYRLAEDYINYRDNTESGTGPGLVDLPEINQLAALELVEKVHPSWSDHPVFVLTNKGLEAAKVLTGRPQPRENRVQLAKLRSKAKVAREEQLPFNFLSPRQG